MFTKTSLGIGFLGLVFTLAVGVVSMADPNPRPTPQPTPPPSCNTNCDEFKPANDQSICIAPDVSHRRECETTCTNGMGSHTSEQLCLPVARYEPQFFSSDDGSDFNIEEDEAFDSTAPCKGHWWVTIDTNVQYSEYEPGSLSLLSNVSEACSAK